MATLHKCDKCGKTIKGHEISVSFSDFDKKFFEKWTNRFDFCPSCVKPLASYVKVFLKSSKKNKK